MSRLTGSEFREMIEAYYAVYAPKINEEQIQEDFENWVYSLVDEGEDLSEYTWDEMYEAYNYINEQLAQAVQLGAAAAPFVLPAIGAVTNYLKGRGTSATKNTPEEERWLNTGSFQSRKDKTIKPNTSNVPSSEIRGSAPTGSKPRIRVAASRPAGSTTSTPRAAEPPKPTNKPQQVQAPKPPSSGSGTSPAPKPPEPPKPPKIDPLDSLKQVGNTIKNNANQVLGKPARERFFGTTKSGQLTRAAATTGVSALDIGGKIADPSKPSAIAKVGSVGPGAVGTVLQGAGNVPGIKDTSMGTGARGTGEALRQVGREMRDQGATTPKPAAPARKLLPGLKESPDWNSAPKPKDYSTLTLGGERKVYIPGQGWQYPTTARRWARAQGYENWDKIPNPPQPSQKPKPEQPQTTTTKPAGTYVPDSQLTPAERRSVETAKRSATRSAGSQQSQAPRPQSVAAKPTPTAAKPLETRMSTVTGKREFVGTTSGGTKYEVRTPTSAELAAARKARDEAKAAGNVKGAEEAAVKAGVAASKPTTPTPAATPARNGFGASTAQMAAQSSVGSATAPPEVTANNKIAAMKQQPEVKPSGTPPTPIKRTRTGNDSLWEGVDAYDLVLEYLFSQGHVDTIEEAHYVMMEMDVETIGNIVEAPGEWFGGIRDKARASRAAQMQSSQPTPKPLPSSTSPFQKPGRGPGNVENRASRDDSGRLTTYGAGGGKAAEASGKSYDQVMQQGAKNRENKRTQPKNQGPDFGR